MTVEDGNYRAKYIGAPFFEPFGYYCGMTVPEMIAAFLKARKPAAFCDECLATNFNLAPERVQQATESLPRKREYGRSQGPCSQCGPATKLVICSIR